MLDSNKYKKLRIAVFFGGKSEEHKISLLSSVSFIQYINKKKYSLFLIGIDKNGRWMLCNRKNYLIEKNNYEKIQLLVNKNYLAVVPGDNKKSFFNIKSNKFLPKIDVAFLLLHGSYGENGSLQGLLEMLNIPYTGSNVLSSAICMDKDITKRILRDSGILVAPSITLLRNQKIIPTFGEIVDKFGIPFFIKPSNQGSSLGISKIEDKYSFNKALSKAFFYDKKILIEKAIIGREIEIGILGKNHLKTSVCGEIIFKDKFYTYKAKYKKNDTKTKLIIPAVLSNRIINKIKNIAARAYSILCCSTMARIDFFLTKDNKIFLNEINTLPGFTLNSMYPNLWENSGLNYSELIDYIILLTKTK